MDIDGKMDFKRKIALNSIIILIIALITLGLEIRAISPILDKVCSDTAKAKATIIANDKATEVMNSYTYDDFVKIYKDDSGNIKMLQSNVVTINAVTSDVASKIQRELINDDESIAEIKLRQFNRHKNIIRNGTKHIYKIDKRWCIRNKSKIRI
ncbi:MAG: hypothetical protein K2H53_01260 [Clostridia bacterium]|nr:hypothetical protein [Clostridia bacterium]